MQKNIFFSRKDFRDSVEGFLIPKEFIIGCTLARIESILGFKQGRLKQGAAFAQLNALPDQDELHYYGDTSVPEHRFEGRRNKTMSRKELTSAAYHYFQPNSKLIKVIPFLGADHSLSNDINYPSGQGAMQFCLKNGVSKPATLIEIVEDYPFGIFRG